MTQYPWKAGERITAAKLRSGIQRGIVSITGTEEVPPTGSSSHFAGPYWRGTADITFDTPFLEPPSVVVTARTGFPGILIAATYTNLTTTGMTVCMARGNQTATNVDWTAIGEPAL